MKGEAETPADAVLRSLGVDPNAQLVNQPPRIGMRPREVLTPEQLAEQEAQVQRRSEQASAAAARESDRRQAMHRRRKGGGWS